jgi:hypothetical protein
MMLRESADLVLVVGFTLVAVLLTAVVHSPTWVEFPAAAVLVLFLPGYALMAAGFAGRSLSPIERFALSLGVSLAVAAGVGLLLHLTPWGISTQSSSISLAVLTLGACAAAAWQRIAQGTARSGPFDGVALEFPGRSLAMFGASAAIAGGALYFSSLPPAELPSQGYTLLWALPDAASTSTIHLGVSNMEPAPQQYVLRANWGNQPLREWSVQLDSTATWQTDIPLDGGPQPAGDLQFLLFSADNTVAPLRETVIRRSSLALAPEPVQQPAEAPTLVSVAPTLAPTVATPAPRLAPTPAPTQVSTPLPTAAPTLVPVVAEWQALQPALDAAWGRDTPRTLALLDDFAARFPNDPTARDKLYAALVAQAQDLADSDQLDAAAEALSRAQTLLPERSEANAALARLTPTPPVRPVAPPRPVAPAVRPAPVAPAPAAPRQPAPTPTKVPFVFP